MTQINSARIQPRISLNGTFSTIKTNLRLMNFSCLAARCAHQTFLPSNLFCVSKSAMNIWRHSNFPVKGRLQVFHHPKVNAHRFASHCINARRGFPLKMEQNLNMVRWKGVNEREVGCDMLAFTASSLSPFINITEKCPTHSWLTRRIHFSLRNWTRNVQQSFILSRPAWIEIDISHHKLKSNYSRKCFLGLLFVSILRIL